MRSIAHTVISFVLVFSILGPSVLSYMDQEFGAVVVAEMADDKNEKEKSDKDKEEKEEKEYVLFSLAMQQGLTSLTNPSNFAVQNKDAESLIAEVVLPPPESRA